MPAGPGTYGPAAAGGQGLAASALSQQGIPQGVVPTEAPTDQAMSEILAMLKGGQAGAERMLQLLSLLAGATVPQMSAGGPAAPQQPGQAAGGASIQQLLGGQ